jgi:hypothetical protein
LILELLRLHQHPILHARGESKGIFRLPPAERPAAGL